jgi:hypothetical protein
MTPTEWPPEVTRLLQEVSSAPSCSEAEPLICTFDFKKLTAAQCEELCELLADILNELKDDDETPKQPESENEA